MKKLSLRKTLKHTIPYLCLSTAGLIAVNTLTDTYYTLICQQLGYGEKVVNKANEDTTFENDGAYIEYDYDNAEDAKNHAEELTIDVEKEGAVLLENDGLLPLQASSTQHAKVTLFGYKGWKMANSGTATSSLYEALGKDSNYIDVNPATNDLYKDASADYENPASALASAESSYSAYNDAAIVVFGRVSGEGADVSMDLGEAAGHRSNLSLYDEELDLLQYACQKFDNVLVVINSDNTMELDFIKDRNKTGGYQNPYNGKTYDFSHINACVWAGGVGKRGCEGLAQLIDGQENFSGHLVDTYVRDLKSTPSAQNFGDYTYTNIGTSDERYNSNDDKFIQYEEGIYVGYRYYETAYAEAKAGNYDGFDYDKEVLYPFGYGLSYTSYEMNYVGNPTYDGETNTMTFQVSIKNTGSVAGKATAQIYVHAPYDKNSGIEVSEVVLGGFAKTTENIEPGSTVTIPVEVNLDYITSYDYKTAQCYVQLGGQYDFYVGEGSHCWTTASSDQKYSRTFDKIIYDGQTDTDGHAEKRVSDSTTATNQLDDTCSFMFTDEKKDQYATNMSRSDFKGTFPTSPTAADCVAPQAVIDGLKKYDYTADNNPDDEEPELGTEVVYQLIDLRGKDFDDPMWDSFMSQFSKKSLEKIFCDGSFGERADLDGNGVPEVIDLDSPYGYFGHATGLNLNNCVYYNSEVVIASTWNTELAAAVGDALAEEGYNQNAKITGLYGCGLNIHRSPFCGRNQEYFSEDGLIAGKMAASEMGAASEKGLTTYVKHFALNNQETNRGGSMSFANEQAFREVYAKGFEIYIKEATRTVKYYVLDGDNNYVLEEKEMSGATGMMTSYNRVGTCWSGGSAGLATMLRDEWNFTGNICTDGGGGMDSYMNTDQGLHTGATTMMLSSTELHDSKSNTAKNDLVKAVKYNLFNRVNSNAMMGLTPGTTISYTEAPWEKYVTVATVGFAVVDTAMVGLIGYSVASNVVNKKKKEDQITVQ